MLCPVSFSRIPTDKAGQRPRLSELVKTPGDSGGGKKSSGGKPIEIKLVVEHQKCYRNNRAQRGLDQICENPISFHFRSVSAELMR